MTKYRSRLENRNVIAQRGRTSIRLEPELWDALAEIEKREGGITEDELIQRIEQANRGVPRTSSVRVYVVQYFRRLAT